MLVNSEKARSLFLELLHADTEDEVIAILRREGLWDRKDCWRLYGDKEGNFAQVGNQQSNPEAALVEKMINSVDARLMAACLLRGVKPDGKEAPSTVRGAVARFWFNSKTDNEEVGALVNWGDSRMVTEEARKITLAATGGRPMRGRPRQQPCFTIVDEGEGQTPDRLPHTILSLNAKNKQTIRFVQGKFNMGGSGALRFCGRHGLQLVASRRHPNLAAHEVTNDASACQWGFTIVRRENPSGEAGTPVHSEYTYLAPLGCEKSPRKGLVLRFEAGELQLMPEGNKPYERGISWGTAIKLFEYSLSVGASHILMKDGLLYALERLLPEIALPARLYECRDYEGDTERSFETNLAGLVVRLETGKGANLEQDFPTTHQLAPAGMRMSARVYAFKEDKAATYLRNEGIIFTINGQANGYLPKTFFSRPAAVGLQRLKDSVLVLVDCSKLDAVQRENLFMPSRDRLSNGSERRAVEEEIEELLKNHRSLRELQQARRAREVEAALSEEKPLEQVLNKILKSSPTLKALFLNGHRLSRPFAPGAEPDSTGTGSEGESSPFVGRRHPTYFRFKGKQTGVELRRQCEVGRRVRIAFETDAENGYFDRASDRGIFNLEVLDGADFSNISYSISLDSGVANLNLALPREVLPGDKIILQGSVHDPILLDPFVNVMHLEFSKLQERKIGPPRPPSPPQPPNGDKRSRQTAGLALPQIIAVRENDEYWTKYKFNYRTACAAVSDTVEEDGREQEQHTFLVNMDNESLKTEIKYSKQNALLLEAKFKYAGVLVGLALLDDERRKIKPVMGRDRSKIAGDSEEPVEDRIRRVTEALAPVIIPMIDNLSGLSENELEEFSAVGDDS
jgi:hypothetical protein